jgi:hypothetical protein
MCSSKQALFQYSLILKLMWLAKHLNLLLLLHNLNHFSAYNIIRSIWLWFDEWNGLGNVVVRFLPNCFHIKELLQAKFVFHLVSTLCMLKYSLTYFKIVIEVGFVSYLEILIQLYPSLPCYIMYDLLPHT